MNDQCFYRVSVKGIVVDDDGRILLAKEDNGLWELLGGGLDHGEDPIECLKREIHEETGLTVTRVSQSPKYFVTSDRIDSNTKTANVVYEIELESLDFTPSNECQELRFFSVEEMKQVDLFPNVRELLKQIDE
ncbi:NUDIX hydrolase [Candidatus Saccharibacteria bacterium]|nr:NUDIX hydrolase [Candidatus Saccharibacteria bacterium]